MAEPNVLSTPHTHEQTGHRIPAPCAMVIFGASGDLTERKLVPALYYLSRAHLLPDGFSVIGCAKTPYTNDTFRDKMQQAVKKYLNIPTSDHEILDAFTRDIHYIADDFGDPAAYNQLKTLLDQLDRERGTSGNRLFYLATPPSFFPVIVSHLGSAALARPQDEGKSWTHIVIEKPFGRDLTSSRELNNMVTSVFEEDQVYRIDHYLGKETVQNLLVFRFGNGIFEPFWNRRYIDHVQITVAEDIGVENRGAYYEEAGLVRDMIQNHVLSLLSLITMEPPAIFDATAVRDEKSKVMRAIRPIPLDHLSDYTVRGQYVEGWPDGQKMPAYRAEPKVSPQSTTETFAALKLYIDNWRWADVPFYLRSGKRLPKRVSEISIKFRRAPHLLFKGTSTTSIEPNLLSIHIQPDEGMSLMFNAKIPGTSMQIRPVTMKFRYEDAFGQAPPTTAYETLLLDCMLGDAMLFTRADFVDLAWELLTPLLSRWQEDGRKGLSFYEAGTWGPPEADAFIERDGRKWQDL
ncbi:MAG TPA: glucose-6-phosphate dehydrogenase [Terriglobia bacterium]|nr:glucose-6-phosphate dehydrogenase [Terriglobia bacterium]